MKIVVHRVNTIQGLYDVPKAYGAEIDVRCYKDRLILNHEPFEDGESLTEFLDEYDHGLLIVNIKEAGIEHEVVKLIEDRGIKDYFLLDVEFPFILKNTLGNKSLSNVAARYSELESIETIIALMGKVEWVWIDTVSTLPISKSSVQILNQFNTCLVCPERWGRPEDISAYKNKAAEYGLRIDAVMTASIFISEWEN